MRLIGLQQKYVICNAFCYYVQSREVKKRFDSIFESTSYTKSLEAIRKEKKDKKDQLIEAEKDEVDKRNKHVQAQKIRQEMAQIETEITSYQQSLQKLEEVLKLQQVNKNVLDNQVREYKEVQQQISRCQYEIKSQQEVW